MSAILLHRRDANGVAFRVERDGGSALVESWASLERVTLATKRPARLGVLLLLLEDGTATLEADASVRLGFAAIASLRDSERAGLGLPESRSVLLEVRGSGALSDPNFRIEKRLLHADGRPMVQPAREGCFLRIGGTECVLAEPLFSLVEAIDSFNVTTFASVDARFLAWSEIAVKLPEGVVVDGGLRSMRILLATAFTLNPFRNEQGEADFDPLLGRWVERTSLHGEREREFEPLLPPSPQAEFAKRFRSFGDAHARYAIGGATYLMLAKPVETALGTVRRVQKSDAGERRRFLARPAPYLREAFETELGDREASPKELEAIEAAVGDVFYDEGLSERVKGVGAWHAKVLPWLKQASEPWLPPEEIGLQIGDQLLTVPKERLDDLRERLEEAKSKGEGTIEFEGVTIPVTEEAIRAIDDLKEAIEKSEPEEPERDKEGEPDAAGKTRLVLEIVDNLETMGFRKPPRSERHAAALLPSSLATALLPHQEVGVRWLQEHWCVGSPGALLADDMGLGKTLQALTFLAWVREEMARGTWPRRPILLVAPTGLIKNWLAEHDRHFVGAGLGTPVEAVGSGLRALRTARDTAGRELDTALPSLDVAYLQKADWVLTTYETLRDYQHSFGRVAWSVTVFDEAQKMKNPAAALTEAAKAMKQDFSLTMTGTPVENRIEDLWCIVDSATPGGLGALKEFSATYSGGDGPERIEALVSLHRRLVEGGSPPVMLRRMKEEHLSGLPEKLVHAHELMMPGPQAAAYTEIVGSARKGEPILAVLGRLRSVSLHPAGFDPEAGDDAFITASARLVLLFQLLDDIAKRDEKALVFVESRDMQAALAELIPRRYRLREPLLIVNGTVSGPNRMKRVDAFQEHEGFDVMLLSPRAGGVGFTATAANHVVHLSRWWNPAVEDQCTDRVHRIGQSRPVQVHHVIARHPAYGERSFDLLLAALLERKRSLNRSVLAPPAATDEDFQDLYRSTTNV